MSGGSQLPVSALIRQGNQLEDADGKRRSKDEYRRQKNLEEQRKAGQAPAMVDVETGRDINPHIPEFIEKTPWYVPSSGPTLKHQRPHPEREVELSTIKEWYPKGTTETVAFKYRKGACENCGAMGHTKKDCFERPRSVGAKFTNKVIAADDHVLPTLKMGYDAKRDRWNGYDPSEYRKINEEYEQMEQTRKMLRAQNMNNDADGGADQPSASVNDEDMYAEDMAPTMSVDMDSRTRITVRNLRIREDTAKYLYSLDENSAYYDPKSRSMRENPFQNVPGKEKDAAKFAGENFVRYTGEVVEANQAQVFAWQARCEGIDVHALAEPTKLEALKRAYKEKMTEHKSTVTKELIDKYGDQEYVDQIGKELLMAQTEQYVEYNRKGNIIKGQERPKVKSRYDEDVYPQNHTSVWGSYWRENKWGYKCCHSFFKNSYCIGEKGLELENQGPLQVGASPLAKAGIQIEEKVANVNADDVVDEITTSKNNKNENSQSSDKSISSSSESDNDSAASIKNAELEDEKQKKLKEQKRLETRREKRRRKKERQKSRVRKSNKKRKQKDEKRERKRSASSFLSSSSSSSSSASDFEPEMHERTRKNVSKEMADAIRKAKANEAEGRRIAEMGDRKRKYNSFYEDNKMTEVELEAYQRIRIHSTDPMASLMAIKEVDSKKKARNEK